MRQAELTGFLASRSWGWHSIPVLHLLPNAVFFLASIAVILAPGPDILFVIATGIGRGRVTAIVAAGGFASGLSIHTACAVFGISALLMASATAFTCVKIAGAAYLVWLGIKAFRSHGVLALTPNASPLSQRKIFGQAFLMNVLNPKVALFFLAFLPQFASRERGSLPAQLLILGVCFALLAFTIFSLAGYFSSGVGAWLRNKPTVVRWLDRGIGTLFIGLGCRLAFATNR